MLTGYPALRLHLEQLAASTENSNSKTKAIGFLKLLPSRDIIGMALFLQDILMVLHKDSLKSQEEGSVVADVSLAIKTALKHTESFAINSGPSFQNLAKYETVKGLAAGATIRETYRLTCGNGELIEERKKLVEMLCKNMKVRFEDANHGLTKSTAVANFKMWPDKEDDLEGYGDDMVKDIVEHYGDHFEKEQVLAEWPLLRSAVFEAFLL